MEIIDLRDSLYAAAQSIRHTGDFADMPITHGEGTIPLSAAMLQWEARLGELAAQLGRGPIPLALNQARTALAGAIGLAMLDEPTMAADAATQLYVAAGFCQRALGEGSAVGSG